MSPRQAIATAVSLFLLLILSSCSSSAPIPPTPTLSQTPQPTATSTQTPTPLPPTETSTPTPLGCLTQPGRVDQVQLPDIEPVQEFLIYLPPCYDESADARFPVLYLLHGQTYNDDQWVRLGAPVFADKLIQTEETVPFIIVFPDDRYWNLQAGGSFGIRVVNNIVPYVDANYRTLADREHRSLGGLSRGGGWTIDIGLSRPNLFGSLGLHSPAIFVDSAPYVDRVIQKIPEENRPRLWLDVGDADRELASVMDFEIVLAKNDYIHEFQIYTGDHSESYWSLHVEEYLRWYAQAWDDNLSTD